MNRLQLRAEHSAQQFYNRRQIPTEEALAGDGVGNLNVSGRLGWLYVRMRGDSTKVTVAYNASSHAFAENDAVSLQWVKRTGIGFYAIVGYSGAAVYDVFGAGSGDGTGSSVAYHAWQHERMDAGQGGPDPLNIFARMVVPLRARPQTIPDDTLYVETGFNPLTGNLFAGGNSASFFPVPAVAGQARIDLLYLGSDDALHIVAGTPVGGGVTPTLPAVVVPSVPLAFVHLAYSQTAIVEANIYMDPGILRAPVSLSGTALEVKEVDGAPDVTPVSQIIVTNGKLTDNGGGSISLDLSGGGGTALDWFNVKDYGAVGDGATDDTVAVSDTITALDAAGSGVLYFPQGEYKTSGGFTISSPSLICGEGSFYREFGSKITCTSATAILFTVSAIGCEFRDLVLSNTAGSTPSNGSGISIQASGHLVRIDRVQIDHFYIDLDIQGGGAFTANDCQFSDPVEYALKLRNISSPDEGDDSFVDCDFLESAYAAPAAIHIESSGGPKFVNCKINSSGTLFVHGIELAVGAGISTADLLVSNTSIENLTGDGIHVTTNAAKPSSWVYITLQSLEIALGGANTTGHAISIECDALNDVRYVTIGDCVLIGAGGNGAAAINLVKADNVYLSNNAWGLFGSLLAQSGCTNVFQTGSGTVTSVGSGTGLTGGPITASGTLSIDVTGVAAATYGNSTNVPQITVNAQGQITAASNVAIVGAGGASLIPVTNGNAASPEIVFENGDVVMEPA